MEFNKVDEKDIGRSKKLSLLSAIPILFLFVGIIYGIYNGSFHSVLYGFINIVLTPTILVTDFIQVGGIEAAFINVGLVGLLNIFIMRHFRLKLNGILIAAFFTVIGFSFFGKNLYNIIPIYFGGYFYSLYKKISFKDIIIAIMFGTALAPMVSEISFSGLLQPFWAITVAVCVGLFIGFIIVPLSSHMLKFHDGYNLYNIGFTSGILGTVLASVLRSFGITIEPVNIISEKNHLVIIILLLFLFLGLFCTGIYFNRRAIMDYRKILQYKGRLITDFTHLVGFGVTLLNMALLGLLSLIYVLLIGGVVNGPVLAGIFTVVGFGAFGKHIKNCLPVMIGVIITALLFGNDLSTTGIIISVLFSTTLAPIAGTYGPIIGFIAGALHMILVTNVGVIHGGINLYNNGFSGGLVAGVMIPVLDAFHKERNR
ncbi:DUF1576 domain-containing protein [Lachnoclostridium sp.]|uniref:DUF1576 domain-containing protein n=1 Tax=Lachnoclostridium sp. TaxID=2028282 RepID=UPI00289D2DDA|nr:DUF1576 domain-containing protein [Lachnoclostridium sp.]